MATLQAMFKLYDGYSKTISKVITGTNMATSKILQASGATDTFNTKLSKTGIGASIAASGLTKFVSVTAALIALKKGMDGTDNYTNTSARLGLITNSLQEQVDLQNKIFASAARSRGAYSDMATSVAKMGLLAKDAFGNNNELVGFTELVQKSFKVGGASGQEQASGMYQLTQAMAAGKLQGDEFRSIMENAPMIAEAIAKYTGKSKGELKEMSSDGVITADIIKNAMFSMSDDINSKFKKMPVTFADVWNQIKNGATKAFIPVMEQVSELINTAEFQAFVDIVINGFNIIAVGMKKLIDGLILIGNIVSQLWGVIGPLLISIAIVVIPIIIAGIWGMVSGVISLAAGWALAHMPLLMVIGCIWLVILMAKQMGITFQDVFGFVGGIVGVFVAAFYNYFAYIWNIVAGFVNFLGNAFINPIAAIKKLFYDMAVNILGYFEGIGKGIEKIIGALGLEVDITSSMSNLKNNLESKSKQIKDEAGLKEWAKKMDYKDYGFAYSKGRGIGTDIYGGMTGSIDKLFNSNKFNNKSSATGLGINGLGTVASPISVKGDGKGGSVKVDMADEDLKYMRDVAERDYINKFSTATLAPNVTVQFTGNINSEVDTDKMYKRIGKLMKQEIAMVAEG